MRKPPIEDGIHPAHRIAVLHDVADAKVLDDDVHGLSSVVDPSFERSLTL